jgi:hypothetical protein
MNNFISLVKRRLSQRFLAHIPGARWYLPTCVNERVCQKNARLWRNVRLEAKTAFSRFPPVHKADL